MTLGSIIYKLFIGPLELFFEVVFVIANRFVENPAYAIIMLSLAMNFLVLPLYRRADALQAEERDRENRLAPWISHIKKTFRGDERFMMLQAFYRQNNYRPTDSLKGSVSLLLEIPFFIAAYHFLSNLETLRGVSFGPIADLGSPDGLIVLGAVTLNLLPILMTLINVISAAIYMKGFPLRSKIQMYGIALIFLIFLYKSPAGLVFYWTLNNIFSLIKNIFYKFRNPGRVLRILASAAGLALLAFVLFVHPMRSMRSQCIVVVLLLMLQLPVIMHWLGSRGKTISLPASDHTNLLFYSSCVLLTIVTGLLIPSAVIGDSAEEFISITSYQSPAWYIVSAAALAAGTFIIWFGIFYGLASEGGKQIMSLMLAVAAAAGLMDYMFFGRNYGNFSADLQFDTTPQIGGRAMLINLAAIGVLGIVILVIWAKRRQLVSIVICLSCIALIGMSVMNLHAMNTELRDASRAVEEGQNTAKITLSKTGKNVFVLMMDRQIGCLIPYIMNEDPELEKQFDGFTYYSNSISFGPKTNFGSPALYGGYDYTPDELNKRDTEGMEVKHNEALKVMPTLFGDEGYKVTLIEPTYAGYTWIPDLSVFDDHPEWDKYLINGNLSLDEYGYTGDDEINSQLRYRNFFCYSLFKIAPQMLQPTLYDHGKYNAQDTGEVETVQTHEGYSVGHGYNSEFMDTYAVLKHMRGFTKITDDGEDTFTMMSNDSTHEPTMLTEPEYEPAPEIDNREFDKAHPYREDAEGNRLRMKDNKTVFHYQVNMASMQALGDWMDYLRSNGVYDNTRIIIVSDHGHNILNGEKIRKNKLYYEEDEAGEYDEDFLNILTYNSVLLVKDFDAHGFTTDDVMTTNADVPAMATEGLIEDAANPFTGSKLTTYAERPVDLNLIYSHEWHVKVNNGTTFLPADWFHVSGDDVFDVKNWKYIGWK